MKDQIILKSEISDQTRLKLCDQKVENDRQKVKKIFGRLCNILGPRLLSRNFYHGLRLNNHLSESN